MSSASGGRWMYVPHATIDHEVPRERSTFGFLMKRCYAEGRGKVEMAGLLPKDQELDSEKDYLRRTLPRAVARNLADAGSGRGMYHALRAATVVAAVTAAVWGGGVETLYGYKRWTDVRLVLAPESAATRFCSSGAGGW